MKIELAPLQSCRCIVRPTWKLRAYGAYYADGFWHAPLSRAKHVWLERMVPAIHESGIQVYVPYVDEIFWRKASIFPTTRKDRKGRTVWELVWPLREVHLQHEW